MAVGYFSISENFEAVSLGRGASAPYGSIVLGRYASNDAQCICVVDGVVACGGVAWFVSRRPSFHPQVAVGTSSIADSGGVSLGSGASAGYGSVALWLDASSDWVVDEVVSCGGGAWFVGRRPSFHPQVAIGYQSRTSGFGAVSLGSGAPASYGFIALWRDASSDTQCIWVVEGVVACGGGA